MISIIYGQKFNDELDEYLATHRFAPTLTEWLNARLSMEEKEYHNMLMQEGYPATYDFPVYFDRLWRGLGFTSKRNAKRLLTTIQTLNEHYVVMNHDQNPPCVKTHGNCEVIYLSLQAAQWFALRSRRNNSRKFGYFFGTLVRAVHGFQLISIMYDNKKAEIEAHAEALLSIMHIHPVNYLAYMGIIRGKHVMKLGVARDIQECHDEHKSVFDNFTLMARYQAHNSFEVDRRLKAYSYFADNQIDVIDKEGNIHTDCFVWDNNMTESIVMDLWRSIDQEVYECDRKRHEDILAAYEKRNAELEAETQRYVEACKVRIAKANAEKTKAEGPAHKVRGPSLCTGLTPCTGPRQ